MLFVLVTYSFFIAENVIKAVMVSLLDRLVLRHLLEAVGIGS